MIYVLIVLVSVLVFPFLLCLVDRIRGTHWSCSVFGWHNGNAGPVTFDGCSLGSHCSKCGKRVLQDSQGNWFECG